MRSLDLPFARSLSDYEIPQLKDAVLRASRHEANWNSDSPKFEQRFIVSRLSDGRRDDSARIFVISPGCVLLHSRSGLLQLLDVKENELIGHVTLEEGLNLHDCKVQHDEGVKQIVCLMSEELPNRIFEFEDEW